MSYQRILSFAALVAATFVFVDSASSHTPAPDKPVAASADHDKTAAGDEGCGMGHEH